MKIDMNKSEVRELMSLILKRVSYLESIKWREASDERRVAELHNWEVLYAKLAVSFAEQKD